MTNKRSTFGRYKIVSIRLDPLHDFMTLQLPSFLDVSSDKYEAFEIIALVGEKTS